MAIEKAIFLLILDAIFIGNIIIAHKTIKDMKLTIIEMQLDLFGINPRKEYKLWTLVLLESISIWFNAVFKSFKVTPSKNKFPSEIDGIVKSESMQIIFSFTVVFLKKK